MDPSTTVLMLMRRRNWAKNGCKNGPHSTTDADLFKIRSLWLGACGLSWFPRALCSFAYLLHRILVPSQWKCPIKSGITQHYNYIILPKQKRWHSFNCLLCVCPTPPPESHHLHWASCLGQNFQTGILMISCLSISDKKIRNSFLL